MSCCKFRIFNHPVNSKFTKWQLYINPHNMLHTRTTNHYFSRSSVICDYYLYLTYDNQLIDLPESPWLSLSTSIARNHIEIGHSQDENVCRLYQINILLISIHMHFSSLSLGNASKIRAAASSGVILVYYYLDSETVRPSDRQRGFYYRFRN